MSHKAIVKQGPLADNIEAFKAYQVDPECAVVLARSDQPSDDPASYRLFSREEDASASRFLALGYDLFFAVSLRPVQAPLTYPRGEDSIILADVKAAVIDPVAYLIVAASTGDDIFAGLRARFGRAISEHDRYDPMGLFRELQALGDALVRRVTPFDGLKIISCRFESHGGAPSAARPAPQAPVPAPAPTPAPEPAPEPKVYAARPSPGAATSGAPPAELRKYAARHTPQRRQTGSLEDAFEDGILGGSPARTSAAPAPKRADASAFAPRRLRRATPELVQIIVHQPKDKTEARRLAKAADPSAMGAGAGARLGFLEEGAHVAVALDVKGADVETHSGPQVWTGEPLVFPFSVAAAEDGAIAQATFAARVFADDAQVGLIAFARPLAKSGAKPAPAGPVDAPMRRAKKVFLSYSSKDRASVALVAEAYRRVGVACFFDRTSLASGEEWSPRLLKEIERADLFHLFWSTNASASDWVAKEARHALSRRRASWTKRPDITVQMLDGPPWAPHPADLDSINFDDFVRAAIVGYARGTA